MNYLLIYEHLNQGGIETLIVRISNWLQNRGHNVILFLEEEGTLVKELNTEINIKIKQKHFQTIINEKSIKNEFNNIPINCIYTFGPQSGFIGGIIYSVLSNVNIDISFFAGIYHPREFNIYGNTSVKNQFHKHYFKNYLNECNIVFMSTEVQKSIETLLNKEFKTSHIWPLAINIPKNIVEGKPKTFRIVSIGRYVSFKSYNLYLFDIMTELLEAGLDVTWETYGSGPLFEIMRQKASNPIYNNRITINGEVPYADIQKVTKTASVFIGMGTIILEVASLGVPTIPAIAYNNTPHTYGYVYDLPYYCVGERLETEPSIPIQNQIEKLYVASDEEYIAIQLKTKEYIKAYGIDDLMEKFEGFTRVKGIKLKKSKYPTLLKFLYYIFSYNSFLRRKLSIKKKTNKILLQIFNKQNAKS